ncbi:MAG: hypothetical protein IJO19_03000, partial [Clostridia bacterium]|nr:hypothetical protein [Clostridia bacterium]
MKNRLIAVLLSIVIVLTLAPALAYADVNDDPYGSDIFNGSSVDDDTDPYGEDIFGDPTQGHISSHNVTSYPAKASTCEVQGNQAYWYCQECNKYFSDADCTNEISENSWVLPLASHQPELKNAKDATCTENGYTGDLICKICGKKIESGEPIAKLGHDLTVTPAKAATETEDGNTAYWHCSRCNKYFGDAEGKNEIQKDSWIIPATGSNPNDDNDPYGEDIFGDPTQGHISSHNVTSYPAKAS